MRRKSEKDGSGMCRDGRRGLRGSENLAVAPEWRRQGIGRALLEWAGASYRDRYARLRLGTGDVSPALAFYRRCGFREIGRLQEFFIKITAGLSMKKGGFCGT